MFRESKYTKEAGKNYVSFKKCDNYSGRRKAYRNVSKVHILT